MRFQIWITNYKMSKLVRALWLAERSVCMGVCKHSCDIKVSYFSIAYHASTNLKRVLSWKLDKFTLPISSSAKTWKIFTKLLCQFFSLKLTIKARKIRILESIFFAKQELISHTNLRVQHSRLVTIFLFISALNKQWLSPPQRPLCVVGWLGRKKKRVRGARWEGKERRDASAI